MVKSEEFHFFVMYFLYRSSETSYKKSVNTKCSSQISLFSLSCIFCRGLRKLAMRNLGFGIKEMYRGFNIAAQVKLLQRYVPSLKVSDVTRYLHTVYNTLHVSVNSVLTKKMAEGAVSWINKLFNM